MEGQTLGNTLCDLFVLPARYISVMIQRRLGTLRIGILASDSDQFQFHFREFEADY